MISLKVKGGKDRLNIKILEHTLSISLSFSVALLQRPTHCTYYVIPSLDTATEV